jgi:hypothetical protein
MSRTHSRRIMSFHQDLASHFPCPLLKLRVGGEPPKGHFIHCVAVVSIRKKRPFPADNQGSVKRAEGVSEYGLRSGHPQGRFQARLNLIQQLSR